VSRFDISNGYAPSRESKGGIESRISSGPSESLATPGLDTLPPVSPRAQELQQLLESIGQAGSVAGQVRVEMARADHFENAKANEIKVLDEGQASMNASEDLPKWLDRIDRGELVVPDGADPKEYIVGEVNKSTEGMSPAYRQQYRKVVADRAIAGVVAKQSSDDVRFQHDQLPLMASRVLDAKSADEVKELVATAQKIAPRLTEQQVYDGVVLRALNAVADAGTDRTQFDMLVGVLGDRFPDKVAQQEVAFQQAANRNADTQYRQFSEGVDSLYNTDTPFSIIREHVKITAPTEAAKRNALDEIDRREQAVYSKAWGDMRQAYIQKQTDAIVTEAAALMDAGEQTGGYAGVTDQAIPVPGHAPVKVTKEEIGQLVRQQKWQQIDAQFTNPDENLSVKVKWLEKNPGVKVPEWQAQMDGIASRISAADIDKGTIQPFAVDAFRFYKLLGAKNETVRNTMLSDSSLAIYRQAENFQQGLGFDEVNALTSAARALRNDSVGATPTPIIMKKALTAVSDKWGSVQNPETGRAELESLAKQYARATGKSPDDSMDYAMKVMAQDWRAINGWLVKVGNRNLDTVDVSKVASFIAQAHAPSQAGTAAKDYTLVPDGKAGGWRLWFRNAYPADDGTVYQDSDLATIQQAIIGRDARAERAKRQAVMADRAAQQWTVFKEFLDKTQPKMTDSGLVLPAVIYENPPLPPAPAYSDDVGPVQPDVQEAPHLTKVLDLIYNESARKKSEKKAALDSLTSRFGKHPGQK
jgi:hypothetical protein